MSLATDMLRGKAPPAGKPKPPGPTSPEFQKVAQAPSPTTRAKCGWCGEIGGQIGHEAICTMADGPTPGGQFTPQPFGKGPHEWQGKRGLWIRWFHHDCLDQFIHCLALIPPDRKRCRRPGCPYAQSDDGLFCKAHWDELPDDLHDEIVHALDDGEDAGDNVDQRRKAAERWRNAVEVAIRWYWAKDGHLDSPDQGA